MLNCALIRSGFLRQLGFTLVEIMVSIVIVSILLAVGVPSLNTWMLNTQVKTTSESLLSALQLARAEAIRQNIRAQVLLTSASGAASWTVIVDSSTVPGTFPAANQIESAGSNEAGKNVRIGVNSTLLTAQNYAAAIPGGTGMGVTPKPGIIFDAFGRVATDAAATSVATKITRIDITGVSDGTGGAKDAIFRRRVITITDSGLARLCKPALPSTNPQGCS